MLEKLRGNDACAAVEVWHDGVAAVPVGPTKLAVGHGQEDAMQCTSLVARSLALPLAVVGSWVFLSCDTGEQAPQVETKRQASTQADLVSATPRWPDAIGGEERTLNSTGSVVASKKFTVAAEDAVDADAIMNMPGPGAQSTAIIPVSGIGFENGELRAYRYVVRANAQVSGAAQKPTAPTWGFDLWETTIYNGNTIDFPIRGTGAEPAALQQFKVYAVVFEQSWQTVADVDLYVRDKNCGAGSVQLGLDNSFDTKSMVRLGSEAAGKELCVRLHGYAVPPGGRRVVLASYFSVDTQMR